MVRSSLVHRNDVSGKPRASWRRDATAMVRSRHRTDDAGAVWVVLARCALGGRSKIIGSLSTRSAAWYQKREPSFSDAIAAVRRLFWSAPILSMSRHDPDGVEIPAALWERLT